MEVLGEGDVLIEEKSSEKTPEALVKEAIETIDWAMDRQPPLSVYSTELLQSKLGNVRGVLEKLLEK